MRFSYQILTDIKVANLFHIDSILVRSLVRSSEKWYTKMNRKREAAIMNKHKVPKAERFAIVNAEALEELHLDARFVANYTVLENGIIEGAKINGVQLVFSEELNGGEFAIVVLHKSAIGFGKQLEETEAMRLQNAFADGVRGLQVCGVKTLREEAVVKCTRA